MPRLAAAAQHCPFTGVDEPREATLEFPVNHVTHNTSNPDSRQLRNDLNFNQEPRIHQTLHLDP